MDNLIKASLLTDNQDFRQGAFGSPTIYKYEIDGKTYLVFVGATGLSVIQHEPERREF